MNLYLLHRISLIAGYTHTFLNKRYLYKLGSGHVDARNRGKPAMLSTLVSVHVQWLFIDWESEDFIKTLHTEM